MDEKKFNICNLAMDAIILKIAALKNDYVKDILHEIHMKDKDLTERVIALELNNLYEYAILREPDDVDNTLFKNVIEAFMNELPNVEEYKKKYNWNFLEV